MPAKLEHSHCVFLIRVSGGHRVAIILCWLGGEFDLFILIKRRDFDFLPLLSCRYVYCYKCILKTTESEGRCPVSNYEITMDDLIRIYEN